MKMNDRTIKIELHPLQPSEYQAWFDESTHAYAQDKIRAKQWGVEGALERAQKETERFLPEGLNTPTHRICHIVDAHLQHQVGRLWWCITERFGRRIAFIFDLHIDEAFRRKGYATSALQSLEAHVYTENVDALSLHVFAFNQEALALYQKLGYAPSSITMTKERESIEINQRD